MNRINNSIFKISESHPALSKFFDELGIQIQDEEFKYQLKAYLDCLRDDLTVFFEWPYVDRFYRDSYYTYFSSKHTSYARNCIRLSFFTKPITTKHFRDSALIPELKDSFAGFMTIRPTNPFFIGRSMISPVAMKKNDFLTSLVENSTSINGIKLSIHSFPHSSQDTETISCAETTIWCVMEYFGQKYAGYSPVLPSQIINTLSKISFERMIPSHGLNIQQVSLALKEFGFGTRVYSLDTYDQDLAQYKKILNYYIESGIPVIVALKNDKSGHAIIYTGHKIINPDKITKISKSFDISCDYGIVEFFDTADLIDEYVVHDDNCPPFQICSFDKPADYYKDEEPKKYKIKSFVVPLYPKIYLEATSAFALTKEVLENKAIGLGVIQKEFLSEIKSKLVIRFFLTSSRSYKYYAAINESIDPELKEIIVNAAMPKFIWIAELSSIELYSKGEIFGLILLDATGNAFFQSVLMILYPGNMISFDSKHSAIIDKVDFGSFDQYINNLKGEWSKWQN